MDNKPANKSLEERVAALEIKVDNIEKQFMMIDQANKIANEARVSITTTSNEKTTRTPDLVTVSMMSKSYHQASYSGNDVEDRIDFVLIFSSNLTKDIKAFKGKLVIKDLFDEEIAIINFTDETGIRLGNKYEWRGGIEFDKFSEQHRRLVSISSNDVMVSFILEKVLYSDGNRESFT